MNANEIMNDYMLRALPKKEDFKKLLKVSDYILKLEIKEDDYKNLIRDRERLITNLSQQNQKLKLEKSAILIDMEKLKTEIEQLKKTNENLINGL